MVAPDPKGLPSLALAEAWPPIVPTQGEKIPKHHPGGAQGCLTSHLALINFHRPFCLSGRFPFFPALLQQTLLQQRLRILMALDFPPWTAPRSHSHPPTTGLPSLGFPPFFHFLPRNTSKALLPELMLPLTAVVEPRVPPAVLGMGWGGEWQPWGRGVGSGELNWAEALWWRRPHVWSCSFVHGKALPTRRLLLALGRPAGANKESVEQLEQGERPRRLGREERSRAGGGKVQAAPGSLCLHVLVSGPSCRHDDWQVFCGKSSQNSSFLPILPCPSIPASHSLSPSLFQAHHNSQDFATLPCPLFLCGCLLASRFSLSLITECWPLAQLCLSGDLDKFPASKPHPTLASYPFFDSSFSFPISISQLSSWSLAHSAFLALPIRCKDTSLSKCHFLPSISEAHKENWHLIIGLD